MKPIISANTMRHSMAKQADQLTLQDRIAFCSWSVKPTGPDDLIQSAQAIGVDRIQLFLNPLVEDPAWADAGSCLSDAGLTIVSGMFAPLDEDYTSLATIRGTGGIVPDQHWRANRSLFEKVAMAAKELRLRTLTFHAGFIPYFRDPEYGSLVSRFRDLAGILQDTAGADLLLETGQETSESLARFLMDVDCRNVGVNFDPANMILYGMGDPIEAAKTLLPFIRQVHIKDAIGSQITGEWGAEVPVGQGEVDWDRFMEVIHSQGYMGDLVIEREAGEDRVADIRHAAGLVSHVGNQILGQQSKH